MNANTLFRRVRLLLALTGLGLLSACAVFDRDNRLLLNKMDEWVKPRSTAARVALAPVAIPVGTLGLAADAALIHPVVVVPKAADDVYKLYWKPREMDWLRKGLILPLVTVLTPPTFTADWFGRAVFDID
jgi:hypothetical protein